jgi:hypothetical protein
MQRLACQLGGTVEGCYVRVQFLLLLCCCNTTHIGNLPRRGVEDGRGVPTMPPPPQPEKRGWVGGCGGPWRSVVTLVEPLSDVKDRSGNTELRPAVTEAREELARFTG